MIFELKLWKRSLKLGHTVSFNVEDAQKTKISDFAKKIGVKKAFHNKSNFVEPMV